MSKYLGELTEDEVREIAPLFFHEMVVRLFDHCYFCADCDFIKAPDAGECPFATMWADFYKKGYILKDDSIEEGQYSIEDEGEVDGKKYLIVYDNQQYYFLWSVDGERAFETKTYPWFHGWCHSIEEAKNEIVKYAKELKKEVSK